MARGTVRPRSVAAKRRLSRRGFLRMPLCIGAAVALSRIDCGGLGAGSPVHDRPLWRLSDLSFQGAYEEADRFGRGEIRCIEPRVLDFDPESRIVVVERYTRHPTDRGVVEVPLTGARSAHLIFTAPGSHYDLFLRHDDVGAMTDAFETILSSAGALRGVEAPPHVVPPAGRLTVTWFGLTQIADKEARRIVCTQPTVWLDPVREHLAVRGREVQPELPASGEVPVHALGSLAIALEDEGKGAIRQIGLSWSASGEERAREALAVLRSAAILS